MLVITSSLLGACSGLNVNHPSQKVPATVMDMAPLAVPALVVSERLEVLGGTPTRVQDVLRRGEEVLIFWIQEAPDTEVEVYTERGLFGSVKINDLKLQEPIQVLNARALHNIDWKERGIAETDERRRYGPLFKVRGSDQSCDVYSIENPYKQFYVIDAYRCSTLSYMGEGRSNLGTGIVPAYVNEEQCSIKVINSFSTLQGAENFRKTRC